MSRQSAPMKNARGAGPDVPAATGRCSLFSVTTLYFSLFSFSLFPLNITIFFLLSILYFFFLFQSFHLRLLSHKTKPQYFLFLNYSSKNICFVCSCIPNWAFCNGQDDCRDSSDENKVGFFSIF